MRGSLNCKLHRGRGVGNKVSYFFTVFFTFAGAKTLAGGRWTVPLTAISLMRSFFRIVSGATSPDLCKPCGRCGCDLMRGAREGPPIGIRPFSKNDTTILIRLTRLKTILIGGENRIIARDRGMRVFQHVLAVDECRDRISQFSMRNFGNQCNFICIVILCKNFLCNKFCNRKHL